MTSYVKKNESPSFVQYKSKLKPVCACKPLYVHGVYMVGVDDSEGPV